MPRYFIDLHDGIHFVKETEGFDLSDDAALRGKLVRILSKIAQGLAPVPERQDYLALVREAGGRVVLRARLSLDIERVDGT
ncbi:DUF6894 family protein [Methylobacterium trifolii]|uniref:DUF6894 domain-containing protein n=1 Tax=Methylobacterium trifolii TaxID=1003092 RepID=A0ABQ4U7W9_9HYPH|nr:hypothetical protein [Methylobacterium trifolii]GJE62250.1 hypothetical protein MPOCJGCO_4381 [Methylobacterium trifolii]